jgi:hypothetical protein
MKRITKSSFIAALSLTSLVTSMSADNLSDAFTNGKVKGEIKSVYSNSNFLGNEKSDSITTVGGSLAYATGDFYGFSSGVTFQVSHILNDDNNNNVFKDDLNASDAVLSEAYLEYKFADTSAKIGRQFIYTPLVSTAIDGKSSERLIKDSFEAYLLTNTTIPNTTIVAGYVDKYQAPANNEDLKFEQHEDGDYTLFIKNNSINNLELQAQYLKINAIAANSDKDDIYFQADYKLGNQTLSAQYLGTNNETGNDGELFGLKATGPLGISNLGYVVAYNSSTKDGDVNLGVGTGTTDTAFTAMPVNGGGVPTRANTDTLVGGIVIPITDVTTVAYAGKSFSDGGLGDVTAVGAMAIYPFYKNFLLKANYEHVEIENTIAAAGIIDTNTDVTRVYLSYKF